MPAVNGGTPSSRWRCRSNGRRKLGAACGRFAAFDGVHSMLQSCTMFEDRNFNTTLSQAFLYFLQVNFDCIKSEASDGNLPRFVSWKGI